MEGRHYSPLFLPQTIIRDGPICHVFALCCRRRRAFFPFDHFQVEHENGIDYRDQQQGRKGRDGQATDLCITKRLPKRSAMEGEGTETEHCSANSDQNRPETNNPRVEQRFP